MVPERAFAQCLGLYRQLELLRLLAVFAEFHPIRGTGAGRRSHRRR
jgi:hypothetical protein